MNPIIQQDYLTIHDTEKRSDLSTEEKKDLIINAIASLYYPSKCKNIQLKRTKENGLIACSRNEVLLSLQWLDKGKHLIKVDPASFPFKIIRPSNPMHGDSYREPVNIDPKTSISIEVLPVFDSWYKIYRFKKDRALNDLEPDQINAIKSLFCEIDKKFRIKPAGRIVLNEPAPIINTIRHDALEYLKDEGVLYFNADDFLRDSRKIEIYLNLKKFESFKNKYRHMLFGQTQDTKQLPMSLPLDAKWEDITIEFIDGHTLNIKCKGKTIRRDYKEMGFEDSKSHRPNKQWEFLITLAENQGEIAWDKSSSRKAVSTKRTEQDFGFEYDENISAKSQNRGFSIIKAPNKTKKIKQLLSKTLKTAFHIQSDPFFPYKDVKAYKIRLKLIA